MNTTMTTAKKDDTQNDAIQAKRTRCEVWTRVMGYHRPVANFNVGKKSEHYSRQHFSEGKTLESPLCESC